MAVCGIDVKALALQLNMFCDCYGSQVNMILTWLPQTLWRPHISQKVLQNRRFQFGRNLLNQKRLCSFIQPELLRVACLHLQEPRTVT